MKRILTLFMIMVLLSGIAYSDKPQWVADKNEAKKAETETIENSTSNEEAEATESSNYNDDTETDESFVSSENTGTTESSKNTRTVYLIVPSDASDLNYHAITESTSGAMNTADITTSKATGYQGNSNIDLVKLKITPNQGEENTLKIVAGYKYDSKYYFLVNKDADADNIKSEISAYTSSNSSGTPFDAFDGSSEFDDYDAYPGHKTDENIRLSLISIDEPSNLREFSTGSIVAGSAGVNPSASDNNELEITYNDGTDYIEFKNGDSILNFNGNDKASEEDPLVLSKATSVKFRVKTANKSDMTINNVAVINTIYTLSGNMTVKLWNDKYNNNGKATGQWWINLDGTCNGGDTIVLLEDDGVVVSTGIDVVSSVEDSSRKRKSEVDTSLIEDYNFRIKSIEE